MNPAVPAPCLVLSRNETELISIVLDATGALSASVHVAELQPIAFQLDHPEAATEYRVVVGNADATSGEDVMTSEAVRVTGRRFGKFVLWEENPYFESARGSTWVRVQSRAIDGGVWRGRGALCVIVKPSKLSDVRFHRMEEDLRRLSAGLVFDLVSKSVLALSASRTAGITPTAAAGASSQLELRRLEASWRRLAPALAEVERTPTTRLERVPAERQCWGGERLTTRALRNLASAGVDPRMSRRPFRAAALVTQESTATLEHSRIAGVLQLLQGRARACAAGAAGQRRRIRGERGVRDVQVGDEGSLWESVDLPRIARLEEAERRAAALADAALVAMQRPYLRGLTPSLGPLRSPVFDHVPAYRRVRAAAEALLRGSLVVVTDEAADEAEQAKSTSRMYEQWVFLQLVAAFRAQGLRADATDRIVRPAGWQRFTVDIERGARVSFRIPGSPLSLVLRYEPWVFPRDVARERRDSVFRGRPGAAAWSPDVLVELLAPNGQAEAAPEVLYAVVVDAKYTRRIEDRHWDRVRHYLDIKSTRSDRQVVHQVWLSHPASDGEIAPVDTDVEWQNGRLNLPQGDKLFGVLPLCPPDELLDDSYEHAEMQPTDVAIEFAQGLLRYFNLNIT